MEKLTSKIKFFVKSKSLCKGIYRKLFFYNKKVTSDPTYQNKLARTFLDYKYDCTNPKTFNEYLGWLKFNYRNDLWKRCADKIECKKFLEEIGLGDYVPKTYLIAKDSSEIDLSKLPEKFVLKTNNDSGSVFVATKETLNKKIFEKLDNSLTCNYGKRTCEWVYEDIYPKILAEEFLVPAEGKDLIDYKFFVFNGKVKFGFSAHNRNKDVRFYVFDKNYNHIDCEYCYLGYKKTPKKPSNWNKLVEVAEKVGKHFDFCRVDLYNTTKGVKIGEITFFSQTGTGAFIPKKYDYIFGEYFKETNFYGLVKK